jgi:hypothetical protein
MSPEQNDLWQKIRNFELDDPGASLSFTGRLARENGWSFEYTVRVVDEYKKFIFLQCITGHPLTPSDQVDQAWHLHLLYTVSYWIDFCTQTLQKQIHHGPTRGGASERMKFENAYDRTLQTYRTIFGVEPPADVWPDCEERFRDVSFRRVNLKRHWIVRKPVFL